VGRNDEQKPNAGTNVVETETEQMIMSEELDKDRYDSKSNLIYVQSYTGIDICCLKSKLYDVV
jgi:hypothetical protein